MTDFERVEREPLYQCPLGDGWVRVLGAEGLRLGGLTTFHLDEGPEFAYLNVYRVLAEGRLLDKPRERRPARVTADGEGVAVQWGPTNGFDGHLEARYRTVPDESALEVTFAVDVNRAYPTLEVFVANYFTPYHTPRYAVSDTRVDPDPPFFLEKEWYGEGETNAWPRNDAARDVFHDGRWQEGHAINWRLGPDYAIPVTTQQHRYGHAVVLMGREEDCLAISGLNAYHNSQYFHLFGDDVAAGDRLESTLRMTMLPEEAFDDLGETAVAAYQDWQEGDR
jgi:hypothetical protein